jgi:NDP-sugar pyrophosphorylase family protein
MKAMILAAGLGTRLRPLTNNRPKALVEIAGHPLLELTLSRLQTFGVSEVIVNTHHHADMIREYLEANDSFGMRVEISREEALLDTGGGLKKAAWFFLEGCGDQPEPFIVHNVDVICNIDLGRMTQFHVRHDALATIAVQDRKTSRPLVFDEMGQFRGRQTKNGGEREVAKTVGEQYPVTRTSQRMRVSAFTGIHVISPRIFERIREEGPFSIIDSYIYLASQGERIMAFQADEYYWRDVGRPEDLVQAAHDIETGAHSWL